MAAAMGRSRSKDREGWSGVRLRVGDEVAGPLVGMLQIETMRLGTIKVHIRHLHD